MPKGSQNDVLATGRKVQAGMVRAGNRLTSVQLKQNIHDSGICSIAIEMAMSGKRAIVTGYKDGGDPILEWQEMSEGAHIDMIKFIVRKALPDAKEYDSIDDRKALDRWAAVIEADGESVKG